MKKILLTLSFAATAATLNAQVKVGDNHETIDPSAVLELESTDKGFLPPRLTTEQRDAIENPAVGLIIFNTDTNCLNYYIGTEWFRSCGISMDGAFNIVSIGTGSGYFVQGIAAESPEEADILPTQTIEVDVAATGPYSISTETINGITFSAAGEFTETGIQTLTLTASGIPTDFGAHTFTLGSLSFNRKTFVPDRRYHDVTVQGTGIEGRHHRFLYNAFTADNGKVWLQTNLGSDYNKVGHEAFNPEAIPVNGRDYHAYGSLYQWGRYSDGHELINWVAGVGENAGAFVNGYTTELSTTDDPGHNLFIGGNVTDWRVPQNNALWSGVSGTNNPCPSDFYVASYADYDGTGLRNRIPLLAYNSLYKFVYQGQRNPTITLTGVHVYDLFGVNAAYWTSSVSNDSPSMSDVFVLDSNISNALYGGERIKGVAVRCVKN